MQVFEQGSGGAVRLLFVHGWQADHTVWEGVIAALGPGYWSLAVDLPGSGVSLDAGGPYTLERYAAALRETVSSRGLAPVVVVGHSMGATAALRLAVDAPETVSGLVLVASVPASGGGFSPRRSEYLRATCGDPAKVRAWLASMLAGDAQPRLLDVVCEAASRSPREAALESFESWSCADFADATRAIAVPAVVVAPELDAPERQEREVAGYLPNARVVRIAGAGHYAVLEKPAEVAAAIASLRCA